MQSVGPKAEGWQPACRRRYIDTEPLVGRSGACSHPLSGAGTARAAGTLPAEGAEGQGAAAELDRRRRVAKKGKVATAHACGGTALKSIKPSELHDERTCSRAAWEFSDFPAAERKTVSREESARWTLHQAAFFSSRRRLFLRLRTNPLANAWSKASTSRTSRDQSWREHTDPRIPPCNLDTIEPPSEATSWEG